MQYIYTLQSKKDKKLYTGCANNLQKRIMLHNAGRVEATRNRCPLILIHYEAFLSKEDAFAREQWLKIGWGRNYFKRVLK